MVRTLTGAVRKGDLDLVKQFVENGYNINERVSKAHFPLGSAVHNNYLDIAKYLIRKGARLNCRTENNWTPIFIASHRGYLPMVKLLARKGAMLNTKSRYGSAGWSVVYSPNKNTPLHEAVLNGNHGIVLELLRAGANYRIKNGNGLTPMDMAVRNKKWKIAALLAYYGAPIKRKYFEKGDL